VVLLLPTKQRPAHLLNRLLLNHAGARAGDGADAAGRGGAGVGLEENLGMGGCRVAGDLGIRVCLSRKKKVRGLEGWSGRRPGRRRGRSGQGGAARRRGSAPAAGGEVGGLAGASGGGDGGGGRQWLRGWT
jgi:hypothetical protein